VRVEFFMTRDFPKEKVKGYISNNDYISKLHRAAANMTGGIPKDEIKNPWQVIIEKYHYSPNESLDTVFCIESLESAARAKNYGVRLLNLIEKSGYDRAIKIMYHSGWDYYKWDTRGLPRTYDWF